MSSGSRLRNNGNGGSGRGAPPPSKNITPIPQAQDGEPVRECEATEAEVLAVQLHQMRETLIRLRKENAELRQENANLHVEVAQFDLNALVKMNEDFREEHDLTVGRSLMQDKESGKWYWMTRPSEPPASPPAPDGGAKMAGPAKTAPLGAASVADSAPQA